MRLTIAYITSRRNPNITWFSESLVAQAKGRLTLLVIDSNLSVRRDSLQQDDPIVTVFRTLGRSNGIDVTETIPKPTIWQGPHRITKEDWWSKSNALNTAICLCETEWIAFVDDRSVLMPGWLNCIKEAMRENYAVVGTYAKHANLKVENGVITDMGTVLGVDHRPQTGGPYPTKDWYGGHGALPLEWCLRVNGFSEDLCDGLGSEDSMFGVTLHNSGYPIRYDPRMKIIEDRTPGEIDGALKRADKGISPLDKSHRIVEILRDKTSSQNSFDIRNLRDRVLSGEPFPPPSASHFDWFDNQPISEMV